MPFSSYLTLLPKIRYTPENEIILDSLSQFSYIGLWMDRSIYKAITFHVKEVHPHDSPFEQKNACNVSAPPDRIISSIFS